MKQKRSQSDPTPLWKLADHDAHDKREPTEPPLADEFTHLSDLISAHPALMEHRELDGDMVELTPAAHYISLGNAQKSTNDREPRRPTLLPDNSNIPGSLIAQAHRPEGSEILYLAVSPVKQTKIRQYTIHDGHVTDVADIDKELEEDETTAVKAALIAISERIEVGFEEVDSQRIKRKIGAWWSGREDRIKAREAKREFRSRMRSMGPF